MKKVLVYPCGTEIGLEIFRAVNNSIHFELYGGSCSYDHGRFVYNNHIDDLPFISDSSDENDIKDFIKAIEKYSFDFIYPATDSVVFKFAQYKHLFKKEIIVCPDFETAEVTRSKLKTYTKFQNIISTPKYYSKDISDFPVFIKPDVGQGSVGATKINSKEELSYHLGNANKNMLILEYLPNKEYTIDCFTNNEGELIFCQPRTRRRIKSGISVNTYNLTEDPRFTIIAQLINKNLKQRGGWFFQVKEKADGELVLLEIASRIAGTSEITRANGVNLPLMTLHLYNGNPINDILNNHLKIEVDRALKGIYKINYSYKNVYIDYDDTIIVNNKVNTDIIKLLYKCINNGCKIILITRHSGPLNESLSNFRLQGLFDKIIHLDKNEDKCRFIEANESIFIDDSYGERKKVHSALKIPVFSPQEIECLL